MKINQKSSLSAKFDVEDLASPKFAVFGPSFPKLPKGPKYLETVLTQPSHGSCTSLRPYEISQCIPAHDLRYLSPVFLNCSNVFFTLKLINLSKSSSDVKHGGEDFAIFSVFPSPSFGVFWFSFLKLSK